MFSRRHPYLFFMLFFSTIITCGVVCLAIIISLSTSTSEFEFGDKVGVVEITGVMDESKTVLSALKNFRKDESIKAIVLRIDTPGGGVGPAQEIFREIRKTAEKKKIISSLGSVAASGGYYVAAGTDGIIANPGTITGSIGVIMGYTDFQKVFEKIGLTSVVIKSAEYKDIGSPVRDMSEKEKKILQNFVKNIHNQFVRDVAEGRKMDIEEVGKIADGRIFTGEEAKSLGLVDRLGNFEDAVEWAGRLGGIKGEVKTVYPKVPETSLFRYITGSSLTELLQDILHPMVSAGYLYRPSDQN